MKDDIEIVEEDYLSAGVTSPKELILKHLDRMSVYLYKGDVSPSKKESQAGIMLVQTDRRIVTIQAIDFMAALLKPYYDEKMNNYQLGFDERMEKIEIELMGSSIKFDALNRGGEDVEKIEEWIKYFQHHNIINLDTSSAPHEIYLIEKYAEYIKLFEQLNFLLKRKNYLEGEVYGQSAI